MEKSEEMTSVMIDSKKRPDGKTKCPECGSTNLIHDYDTGETVCGDCGLVLYGQILDKGPEWRAFTQEEKASRSRVGMPTQYSVHDKGLSTIIGKEDHDVFGRKLSLPARLQMRRLRKWQTRTRAYLAVDRNLAQAMAELDRLCDKVYIPPTVKEKAAVIYRKALDKSLVRGRNIVAIATAALYVACRGTKTQRTLNEIAKASLVDKKDVARYYRLILREFEIKPPVQDPILCISRIAEKVGITGETQGVAFSILRSAKEKHIPAGKNPMGQAAAALYIACLQKGELKTQQDIAEAADVTEVTVRNRYNTLKEELNLIVP